MSEIITQTPSGTGNTLTPAGTGKAEDETIEVEGKKYVPLEKFSASAQEGIRLAKENETLRKPKSVEVPEDEKRVREILSKAEQEKIDQAKQEEQQLRRGLDDLHTIYGDFDEKKLLAIVDRYGVYDSEENVNWYGAMELYEKIAEVPSEPPKARIPQSKRQGAVPQAEVVTPADISKKSLPELVKEGLSRFGL